MLAPSCVLGKEVPPIANDKPLPLWSDMKEQRCEKSTRAIARFPKSASATAWSGGPAKRREHAVGR
jgi:hypothetical protein